MTRRAPRWIRRSFRWASRCSASATASSSWRTCWAEKSARALKGEYGLATLELDDAADPLFAGLAGTQQVWMSHRDVVGRVPEGFSVAGRTSTCDVAAIAAPARGFYAVQFHLEVVHTTRGKEYLANFVFRVCGMRKRLGCAASRAAARTGNPRVRRHAQRLLLRQRRRGFQRRLRALHAGAGRRSRARRLRRYRPDARRRDRFRAAHGQPHGGARRRAVSDRAGRGHRPGTEAPHHRRGIRARAGAHHRVAPPAGRELDSRTGHDLPGHHRERRHGQGGADQDASQSRGGDSEADGSRAHRGAAQILLQGRSSRGGPRDRAGRRTARPASVPGPGPRHPLPVLGVRRAAARDRRRASSCR